MTTQTQLNRLLHSLKFESIRAVILIATLLIGKDVLAQKEKAKAQNSGSFYFYYGIAGLGSNLGSFQPALRIYTNKFTYTKEQNSYWGERSKRVEFISKGSLRQSSIDSILSLVQGLRDCTVYKVNPCIMSGAIIYITIAQGSDTTRFILHNTFDLTALKIVSIINPYLPKSKELYGSETAIKNEDDCWAYLRKKATQRSNDSTRIRQ